jgi:hypothetical protein
MPAPQLDTTAAAAILKQKYDQPFFPVLSFPDNPLLALIDKDPDFGGANGVIAMRIGAPQGRGVTIGIAQAAQTASNYQRFVATRAFDYAVATITGETILAARGDMNAIINGLTKEIDGAIQTCMRSLAIAMYRNGGGARGQISTVTSFTYPGLNGATITIGVAQTIIQLVNITDQSNFDIGMQVGLSPDDGTGGAGLRTGGATMVTITAVDRDNGLLTANVAWNTISGAATSDFIFQGAPGQGSDYNGLVKGLSGWIPFQPPGATDNFFGVNRSADSRLFGLRSVGAGAPIEETFVDMARRVGDNGGRPSHAFVSSTDWANLSKSLATRQIIQRSDIQVNADPPIGFASFDYIGPKGPIKIVMDINCPKGVGYMLQIDTWQLWTLGPAPQILDQDGLTIRAVPNADAYQVRIGYYAQTVCIAPGWNGVMTF